MVGHPILREIVGADLLGAVARAYLCLPLCRPRASFALILLLLDAACEQLHRLFFVLRLRALRRAFHVDARRFVDDADGRLDLVDVLPASTSRARGLDLEIGGVYLHLRALVDREDGDRGGRGVNAPGFLRRWHTLDTVYARLVL